MARVCADCQNVVCSGKSSHVAFDGLFPHLLTACPIQRNQLILTTGEHEIVRGNQDVVEVAGVFPENADPGVLLHFLFGFGQLFLITAQAPSFQKPLLLFLTRCGVFGSIDAEDSFTVHQIGQLTGQNHLATVDPGRSHVPRFFIHGQKVMRSSSIDLVVSQQRLCAADHAARGCSPRVFFLEDNVACSL